MTSRTARGRRLTIAFILNFFDTASMKYDSDLNLSPLILAANNKNILALDECESPEWR